MHNHNYIDLISSDEEQPHPTHAQTQDLITLTNQTKSLSIKNQKKIAPDKSTYHSEKNLQQNRFSYQDVCNFSILYETSSIAQHFFSLRDYMQQATKNVLFIFGPSGCGKTLMVTYALNRNAIPYEFASGRVHQTQQGQLRYEDNIDLLQRLLASRNTVAQHVHILKQFPISCSESSSSYQRKQKEFRQNVYQLLANSRNRNKYIFILNSEIYSSFTILSENSESRAISKLPNVTVIKMEPYGYRQMKHIIDQFVKIFPVYSPAVSGRSVDQIITEANGDARKALHLIYHRKITQHTKDYLLKHQNGYIKFYAETNQKLDHSSTKSKASKLISTNNKKQEYKEELKVTIFHMLGKFLYGKRANLSYDPNGKKKNNEPSAYYTEQELKQLDPPFYFQPVELLDKSQVITRVFAQLLQQNFIYRYGKVADISNMYDLFRYYDSYLVDGMNRFELLDQMQPNLRQLLAWGILIYNKNSFKDKGLFKIKRSRQLAISKIIARKKQLLRTYYLANSELGKYRLQDMIRLAESLRMEQSKQRHYGFYQQKLLQIVFSSSYKKQNQSSQIDIKTSVLSEQEEESADNCNWLNKIDSHIIKQNARRTKMTRIIMEDSDNSDIQSD